MTKKDKDSIKKITEDSTIKSKVIKKDSSKVDKSILTKDKMPKIPKSKLDSSVKKVKKEPKSISKIKETVIEVKTKKGKIDISVTPKKNKEKVITDFPHHIKKVLITLPDPLTEKSPYTEIANKHKLKLIFSPLVKVESITLREFRKSKINIHEYSSIIFNSKNAIDNFFEICEELRYKMKQDAKYYCASEAIAFYLQKYIQYRKRKVIYANGSFEDLTSILLKNKDTENYLIPCSSTENGKLFTYLNANKFNFKEVIMYKIVKNEEFLAKFKDINLITFFNQESVRTFFNFFPDFEQKDIAFGAFGSTTVEMLQKNYKMKVHAIAPLGEIKSMSMAIDVLMKRYNKNTFIK